MPRITPGTESIVELKDHEPYAVLLAKAPEVIDGSAEFNSQKRLELTWSVVDGDPEDTVKDWVGLKLGQNSAGDVSKLRQLLNALVGKPEATAIAWFDSDTFEWSYDGTSAHAKLTVGLAVTIRGKRKPKKGAPDQLRYRIETYTAATAMVPPAPNGFQQISPDGKYGWNGKAWVEIQASIPPPPAPSAIPPPPTGLAQETSSDPDEIPF